MRNELAGKLELIGEVFEIDGMTELLGKFDAKMKPVKFSAVVIQIESLIIKEAPKTADKLVAMKLGITEEETENLDDAEYTNALKDAIIGDVLGFFASSPRTDGQK